MHRRGTKCGSTKRIKKGIIIVSYRDLTFLILKWLKIFSSGTHVNLLFMMWSFVSINQLLTYNGIHNICLCTSKVSCKHMHTNDRALNIHYCHMTHVIWPKKKRRSKWSFSRRFSCHVDDECAHIRLLFIVGSNFYIAK